MFYWPNAMQRSTPNLWAQHTQHTPSTNTQHAQHTQHTYLRRISDGPIDEFSHIILAILHSHQDALLGLHHLETRLSHPKPKICYYTYLVTLWTSYPKLETAECSKQVIIITTIAHPTTISTPSNNHSLVPNKPQLGSKRHNSVRRSLRKS